MKNAIFVMNQDTFPLVYPAFIREEISSLVNIVEAPMTQDQLSENLSLLQEVEIIITGWGAPVIDQELLDHAPRLELILYGAGSIKAIAKEGAWERGIRFTTAVAANGIPVAEFTISQILFCLKKGWRFVRDIQETRQFPTKPFAVKGAFRSKVGLISLSTVGRNTLELLRPYHIDVLAYDPFVTQGEAEQLGITLCSLEEIFQQADVVSLHTPLLEETRGMIKGTHFRSMKHGASFINTARGAIVKEKEMVAVLQERTDITTVLDVTNPEPPTEDSLLYKLPNVVVTPHMAGSEGEECGRMGLYMLEELKRYLTDQPLKWEVTKEQFIRMA